MIYHRGETNVPPAEGLRRHAKYLRDSADRCDAAAAAGEAESAKTRAVAEDYRREAADYENAAALLDGTNQAAKPAPVKKADW